jgi:hypothetical protein
LDKQRSLLGLFISDKEKKVLQHCQQNGAMKENELNGTMLFLLLKVISNRAETVLSERPTKGLNLLS